MKQILISAGQAKVADVPVPQPDHGQVLVRLLYSLISTGTEMAGVKRSKTTLVQKVLADPAKIGKVLKMAKAQGAQKALLKIQSTQKAESATGYSCCGVVAALGDGAHDPNLKVGDRVACAGAGYAHHAEFVAVPRNLVVKVPEKCSSPDAASVTVGAIALQGVRRAEVRIGETVAVIGLGLIGQITAQLVRAAGCRVIGFDIADSRVQTALALGMDVGGNPAEESLEDTVNRWTDQVGADATIITADSADSTIIQQAMLMTRKKGRVVVVGAVGMDLQRKPFYEKEIDLLISCSYGPGRYDKRYEEQGIDYPLPYVRWTENRNMGAYLRLIAEDRVRFAPLVQQTFPIEAADDAFDSLKGGGERPLAVLIEFPGETPVLTKAGDFRLETTQTLKGGAVGLGVVGCGSFTEAMHLPNIVSLSGSYTLKALAGRDGVKLRRLGRQFNAGYVTTDYRQILDDPDIDVVLIGTRHNLHAKIVEEAIEAGKAVLVEKPLAVSVEELDRLRRICEERDGDVRLMVGFNRRFAPCVQRAAEILHGRVHPLMIVYRVNAGYVPMDHWVHTEEGGGRIIGEACHMLDAFRFLIGRPAAAVDVASIRPQGDGLSPRDNIAATVTYGDGSLATLIYTALGSKEASKETIEIFCDQKILFIDDFKSLTVTGARKAGWHGNRADKGHLAELSAFAAYLEGKAAHPIPLAELFETTALSLTIDRLAMSENDNE